MPIAGSAGVIAPAPAVAAPAGGIICVSSLAGAGGVAAAGGAGGGAATGAAGGLAAGAAGGVAGGVVVAAGLCTVDVGCAGTGEAGVASSEHAMAASIAEVISTLAILMRDIGISFSGKRDKAGRKSVTCSFGHLLLGL
jgi:hypothetical protein